MPIIAGDPQQSLTEKLKAKQMELTVQLSLVNTALTLLQGNPQLQAALDAIERASRLT